MMLIISVLGTNSLIFLGVCFFGFILGRIPWIKIIENKKRKMQIKKEVGNVSNSDNLNFLVEYTYYGGYSTENKLKNKSLHQIFNDFRNNKTSDSVLISSKFNDVNYAMCDLDSDDKYQLFKTIYSTTPYVIFSSSPDHYWGFLDIPYKKLDDLYYDTNWKVCNDQSYVNFTRLRGMILIRGLYEDSTRKPFLLETNGTLSKNFQLFIDKLSMYYNREGLELSVLKFKDPNLLIQFNRKKKLQQLNNVE